MMTSMLWRGCAALALATPVSAACILGSTVWKTNLIPPQTGWFAVEFDATPWTANMDGVTTLSAAPALTYADNAVLIRFSDTGVIDARNGGSYAAQTTVAYTPGTSYHFRVEIDVAAGRYSVFVTPAGSTEKVLATDYAFLTQQSGVTTLSSWGMFSEVGSHQVCNFVLDLCQSDAECDDGLFCNGEESCLLGSCLAGDPPCQAGEVCDESSNTCEEATGWIPPMGIPAPPFGIHETVESVYGSAGYFTHYVDNSHPSATDSSNPNGSPTRPRRTIPANLPAGSVVQVRGGTYYGSHHFSGQGTAQQPIFIVGTNMPRFEGDADVPSSSNSRYIILDGLHLACQLFISPPSHHICLRNSRVGPTGATGIAVGYGTGYATHLVIYNNTIADCGAVGQSYAWNQNPGADVDAHGIKIDSNARDCWVVDNVAYHNYGNFIQLSNANYAYDTVMRTYIGGNHAYENRQSAIGIKVTTDTFVSQNLLHGHHEVQAGNYAAGVAFQYGARNVWIMGNEIYDNDAGVKVGSDSGGAGYIIGNLIYDCRYGGSYSTGSAWAPAAIMYWGGTDRYIANNTIYHCDGGIHSPAGGGSLDMVNNLIADLVPNRGRSVFLESSGLANYANLRYCGFDNTIRIQWGSGNYTSLTSFRNANPSREVGCQQASNLGFRNPTYDDFHLLQSSPAVDTGVLPGVCNTFTNLYGPNIRVDLDGISRPQGAAWDMGASEFTTGVSINPGDCDEDGDLDLDDVGCFIECLVGPAGGCSGGCDSADVNQDGDVDLVDFAELQMLIAGS